MAAIVSNIHDSLVAILLTSGHGTAGLSLAYNSQVPHLIDLLTIQHVRRLSYLDH